MVVSSLVVISISLPVTAIFVGLRIYMCVRSRRYKWTDFALICAWIMQCCLSASQIVIARLMEAEPTMDNILLMSQMFVAGAYFYFTSLWAVKISLNLLYINLTRRIETLNVWSVRSVYILIFLYVVVLVTFQFGCFPPSRRWEGPIGKAEPCPNILQVWDFWTHFAIHLLSEIWLAVLPFSTLAKISESRLRVAVCIVYSLAGISIIFSIIRAILLGINTSANLNSILAFSNAEVSIFVIIGALPCMSSVFTRKYVYGSSSRHYQMSGDPTVRSGSGMPVFNSLGDDSSGFDRNRGNLYELSKGANQGIIGRVECSSPVESTENIIGRDEIKKVTTVTVAIS